MSYSVYMVQNSAGKLYVGVSENPEQRLKEHNTHRGAVYAKTGNFKLVFREEYQSLAEARRREVQIKKWRRNKKETLIQRFALGLPTKESDANRHNK